MLAILAVAAGASSASAIVFQGPSYTPPGGASCTLAGTAGAGGATWTCSQTVANYSNLYIGIKNNNAPAGTSPQGESMDSNAPSNAVVNEVFVHSSTGANTIVYTGTTRVWNDLAGAFQNVDTRLTLTFNGSGAMVTDATTIALSSTSQGAVHSLWRTTAASFTVVAVLEARDAGVGAFGPALTYFGTPSVHGKNTRNATDTERANVDIGFYYSTCGDSLTDTLAEDCDLGGANGSSTSCCTSTCDFRTGGEICRTSTGECDPQETCLGSAATCPTDSFTGAGTPCTDSSPPSSGNCLDAQCNGSGACDQNFAAEANGTACIDGLFCNGTDTCQSGTCSGHSGDPCVGPDGDTDCAESCDEGADNCLAADPDGSSCRPAAGGCDEAETCSSGTCPPDAVQMAGSVCNAGSGDSCDPDEVCDGSSVSCPSDTITPAGTTCRAGSGDSCDPDETCTGVADAPCPGDVVQSGSTVCRPGSGDTCDPDESCTGTPGDPCPPDDVEPSSTVCRPGSGDQCDPDEFCPGVPGGTCAADVVLPSSSVCNPGSGDACDPDELCPGVPGGTCAADIVAPASTVCRAATGTCDVAENCPGVANAACPADASQPDDTPCPDGAFCNGDETCQSGICTAGADPCSGAAVCNESTDMCLTTVCPETPLSCRTAAKSLLLIKNKADNTKDKLIWKFIKGDATTQADFADPTQTADYALCIYAGALQSLAGEVHVAPGSKWTALSTKGYKYKDPSLASDGTQKVILKGTGVAGKTKALLLARGDNAPDPIDMAALDEPVTAQLINYETGICWQGTYTVAIKNTTELYKAKQQ